LIETAEELLTTLPVVRIREPLAVEFTVVTEVPLISAEPNGTRRADAETLDVAAIAEDADFSVLPDTDVVADAETAAEASTMAFMPSLENGASEKAVMPNITL
jgi:hypothetical protein